MDIPKGDHVHVNLAPFIGSVMPSKESIPCVVVEANGLQVQVRTLPPYREVTLWILSSWIEGKVSENRQDLLSSRS